jgi:hypothetical protein
MLCHAKLIGYQSDAQDAHFDYLSLFSDAHVQKFGNRKKNVKTMKEPSDENQNRVP